MRKKFQVRQIILSKFYNYLKKITNNNCLLVKNINLGDLLKVLLDFPIRIRAFLLICLIKMSKLILLGISYVNSYIDNKIL